MRRNPQRNTTQVIQLMKTPDQVWAIEDHVCRVCFNRVLSTTNEDGTKHYRCSGCGLDRVGKSAREICACGITLPPNKSKNMGVRCQRNDKPTPDEPLEIYAQQH